MSMRSNPPILIGLDQPPLVKDIKASIMMAVAQSIQPGLMIRSAGYKPHRYPWAYELWKKHEQVHWMAEEVPLGEDIKDWHQKLNEGERNLLTQIFRLFTKSDEEVANNYMTRLGGLFKPTEVTMMLGGFGGREATHIDAYSLLLETIGMPDVEYQAFAEVEAMRAKVEYWNSFDVSDPEGILKTLAMFGGFAEGLQVFASFAMLMNFPRFNKMKGMGQIVSWSVRDESIHCEGILRLFHEYARETGALTQAVKDDIREIGREVVRQEHAFIDVAFEMGGVEGMEPVDIKNYVEFIADWRMAQMDLPHLFGYHSTSPIPWLQPLLSGVEHANFFEARATGYSKAASRGTYDEVWSRFDGK